MKINDQDKKKVHNIYTKQSLNEFESLSFL